MINIACTDILSESFLGKDKTSPSFLGTLEPLELIGREKHYQHKKSGRFDRITPISLNLILNRGITQLQIRIINSILIQNKTAKLVRDEIHDVNNVYFIV